MLRFIPSGCLLALSLGVMACSDDPEAKGEDTSAPDATTEDTDSSGDTSTGGDDGTGDEGTGSGDEGTGTGDEGTGDEGTGTGDEGGDAGAGGDAGSGGEDTAVIGDHELDGMWQGTVDLTATISDGDASFEVDCSGTLQFMMDYPTFGGPVDCDLSRAGDSTWRSGTLDGEVSTDEVTVEGTVEYLPLSIDATGTLDGTTMTLSVSGSQTSSRGEVSVVGTIHVEQLPPPE